MGLGKWWLRNGPGSSGSIAKAMARSYSRIRMAYPAASEFGLLMATLRTRYSDLEIDNTTAIDMVEKSGDNLAMLSVQIVIREIPSATGAMLNAPEVFSEMINVVYEITDEFAPGA